MDNVDLTLGHLRASRGVRDGAMVDATLATLADLPLQRVTWCAPPPATPTPTPEVGLGSCVPFTAYDAHGPEGTRLIGTYRRKRGLQMRYTYSGAYWPETGGSTWVVAVRCNRRLQGTSAGTFRGNAFADEAGLRALVERSIENLPEMRE